ncbi:hypothetical protein Holit_00210 [Hollandina sp. SP2]
MKPKMIFKLSIDLAMTVLLPVQMAFQVTGHTFHEWSGAVMIVLFLTHNILNIRWYKNLFRGAYTVVRIFQTIINLLVLASAVSLAISGAIMSEHVFSFLYINGGMAFARLLHLAAAYWAFVLMSMHLGLHWGMLIVMFQKPVKRMPPFASSVLIPRIITLAVAGYGAWTFYKANIVSYMFLFNQFAFLDYEKNSIVVFAEYIAMIELWTYIAYYAVKIIKSYENHKNIRRSA